MDQVNAQTSEAITARREPLARAIVDRQYATRPELRKRYGTQGRVKCVQDALYHLDYLAHAIHLGSPVLFTAYVVWAKAMLAARKVAESELDEHLETMQVVLSDALHSPEMRKTVLDMIQVARERAAQSAIDGMEAAGGQPLPELARRYLSALLKGERQRAARFILDAVAAGTGVRTIYLNVFQPAQHEIGRLWQLNHLSVAEEHYCTAATQVIMAQLYPHLFATPRTGRRMVATCANGELHEISARMVADIFELEGWDTFYLGANVPPAGVVDMVARHRADVLGISTSLTVHVRDVASLIEAVRKSPAGSGVKILVGGHPFNTDRDLWRIVGADAYAPDAGEAVLTAGRLLRGE